MARVATELDSPSGGAAAYRGSRFGWRLGRELLLILGGFLLYRLVRLVVKDEIGEALANSRTVIDWERALGIFNEVRIQAAVVDIDAVVWLLNRYYFFAHFTGTVAVLAWLYVRHYDHYGRIRRVMFGVTFVALAVHLAFPLAPPRWFPNMGFVDTLQTFGPKIYDSEAIASTANQIAAMPSLHVGWALIGAWGIIRAGATSRRYIAVAHPALMTAAVVITANHWWLDVIAALALVVGVIGIDTQIQTWISRHNHRYAKADGGFAATQAATQQEPRTGSPNHAATG